MYEQTYKIDDYEVTSTDELEACMDEDFTNRVASRFDTMHEDFNGTLTRHNILF
nr:hypothetical protein [uncultured Dyadobacter sp.]